MAQNPKLTNVAANATADAVCALLNGGSFKIYDGTQPATANTAISTQNLLVSLTLSNPAASAASGGVATFSTITSGTAVATGTAAWFRAFKSDGTTAVFDGSVGTSASDIILTTTAITSGGTVGISSFTYTEPKG